MQRLQVSQKNYAKYIHSHPVGKNSQNLVTLLAALFRMRAYFCVMQNRGLSILCAIFLVQCRVARFFLGAIYQRGEKYTKLPQNIPDCRKIFQMAVK
jgi:hypothetical protein